MAWVNKTISKCHVESAAVIYNNWLNLMVSYQDSKGDWEQEFRDLINSK